MTESTRFLTAAQAAARLGIKPATLYAYVSRGILVRERSADGRTSLFDPAQIARLERRAGSRRSAPADVTVASEICSADGDKLLYRGIDPAEAAATHRFEEIATLLWTGSLDATPAWRPSHALVDAARAAGSDDVRSIAAAFASVSSSAPIGAATGAELIASLVAALPGPDAGRTVAARLAAKSSGEPNDVDRRLILECERGLTHAALVARLVVSNGGGIAQAVAAAMWATPGADDVVSLVAQSASWIAHAIEEHRHPTPYRLRIAYTGRPRQPAARRTLDVVRDYLERS